MYGQAQLQQHGTDVSVLELDGRLRSAGQDFPESPVVVGLAVVPAEQVQLQHVEVVGDQQADFLVGPDGGRFRLLFGLGFDLESQPPQLVVGLARCFAAAELAVVQDLAGQVPEGDPDDGLGGVAFAVVDQFVPVGLPNGWSIPASRSARALSTWSRVRPLGIDWGMRS